MHLTGTLGYAFIEILRSDSKNVSRLDLVVCVLLVTSLETDLRRTENSRPHTKLVEELLNGD